MKNKKDTEIAIRLSLLDVSDTDKLIEDIDNILSYVNVLKGIEVAEESDIEGAERVNRMREDEVFVTDPEFPKHFLKFAPSTEGGYIKVNQILK